MCERVISDQTDKAEAKPNQHDWIALQHAMQDNSLDRVVLEHSSTDSFLCPVCSQIEFQAKLLNYFLGSNKSNINHATFQTVPNGPAAAQETHCVIVSVDCQWMYL